MSFNGSGQFLLNSGGLPYVTGTTISSTHANNLNTDLATGLSTCITKDGQTTVTANLPMATFRHTNVGAATARTDYARASQVQDSALVNIGTIAGTNTITGSLSPAITAYAAGQRYSFIPANTNTGATTININSVGARNVFWNGAACVGGEIRQNIPCVIYDDGTQMHIVGNGFNAPFLDTHAVVEGSSDSTKKVRLEVDGLTTATTRVLTVQDKDLTIGPVVSSAVAVTSGTSVALSTTIPAYATGIDISLNAVSTNGSSNLLLQIGPSGGIESTNYDSGAVIANTPASASSTAGFLLSVSNASTAVRNGVVHLILLDASTNTWALSGNTNDVANVSVCSGSKSLAGVLTRVSITTVNGTDAFDGAGKIGIRVT